jgi:hypothetical protein
MADRDIFMERALPPDSNIAQALDALVCVAILVAIFEAAARSPAGILVALGVAVASGIWAYAIRTREIEAVISSVGHAMNAIYQITDDRLRILKSELDKDVFAAVDALKREPMSGVGLANELIRVVPRKDLLQAMPILFSTLEGEVPSQSSDASGKAEGPSKTQRA